MKENAMTRRILFPLAAALLVLPGRGQAQDTPKPEAPKAESAARSGPTATLRVQLVIARFQGEKKLASLPYTFVVTAGGSRARMRMGVDTPVPTTTTSSDTGKPMTAYQYKTVGTNIDCSAIDKGDGRYQLSIGVENSSALTGAGASVEGVPLFRRFETYLDPVLHDGQSVQTVASTDPVTGEVVKIDVTMNVVK
jgi:hypothetical protein